MPTRREATTRQSHPTARRSAEGQSTQRNHAQGVRQDSARRVSAGQAAHQQSQPSRRRSAQGQAGHRQQSAARHGSQQGQARRRPSKRRSSIDTKVVSIVAVSVLVVLGVVGFFAQRRGLLDWTGIGMRKVGITVRAEGFDADATPIPVHVAGKRSSGVDYERDLYITAGQESISLPQGEYTATVTASPIAAGGTLYTIPATPSTISIEGRTVQVSGNSTGTLTLDLSHLDIIDATDAQVDEAITAAQAAKGKGAAEAAERNVPALQRLRQQSVLPDDMPDALVLESTMSGWSTTVEIKADGSFTGTYTQLISSQSSTDYPNGTAYTCTFSGSFTDVERIGETGFRMTLGEVTPEHEVGEKWVEDGVLNIGSQPLGFETGSTFELWRPGTPTEDLGWWLSAWCVDYANTGIPEQLDRWALDNVDASYGFFSEGPRGAATVESDSDADTDQDQS